MKVIDIERKENVFRLYLGEDDCKAWGDDWDDKPASCNAGLVYDEYVVATADFVLPFDTLSCDPTETTWGYGYGYGAGNEPYSKEDYWNHKAPVLVILPEDKIEDADSWNCDYRFLLGDKRAIKMYLNEDFGEVLKLIQSAGGVQMRMSYK